MKRGLILGEPNLKSGVIIFLIFFFFCCFASLARERKQKGIIGRGHDLRLGWTFKFNHEEQKLFVSSPISHTPDIQAPHYARTY